MLLSPLLPKEGISNYLAHSPRIPVLMAQVRENMYRKLKTFQVENICIQIPGSVIELVIRIEQAVKI